MNTYIATIQTIFIVFKLTGVLTWSWWWVFSPLWITAALLILAIVVSLIWGDKE